MTPPLPMTPQPASNTVGAGAWVSGTGNSQTSGTPVDYAEYKQWLTVEYSRIPTQGQGPDANPFRSLGTLSSTVTKNVNTTQLHYNVVAHTSCTIVSVNYNASAFYQPQKFQLNAVGYDSQGNTGYGDLSGSANSYIFGPQGTILTTQPYIQRHIKTAADVAYNMTTKGTTHYLKVEHGGHIYRPGNNIGQDFGHYMNHPYYDHGDCSPYDASAPFADDRWAGDPFRMYGGSYSVSSEPGHNNNANGLARMISFIEETCGDLVSTTTWRRYIVHDPQNSNGQSTPDDSDHVDINPYYDTSRHDYS